MSKLALNQLLASGSVHDVSFRKDGSVRVWPELVGQARRIKSGVVAQADVQTCAIDIDDPFDFASALVGVWSAGRTAVAAPRVLLHGQDASLDVDAVITSASMPAGNYRSLPLADFTDDGSTELEVSDSARTVLYTSGSTGDPKAVLRQLRNMEAEINVLNALWPMGSGRVFSTVSHRHIYGMLFRLLWPLLARRPMASFDLQFPEDLVRSDCDSDVLIASPALLKRLGHLQSGSHAWSRVFSSGGLLTSDAASDCERVLGACPVEVLGSTETSGVAWRCQASGAAHDWTVLPTVRIRTDKEGFLESFSGFSGMDDWVRMGDYARLGTGNKFELLGRGDHIAKIEDKRVSLAAIEQQLMSSDWVDEAAAVALDVRGRQQIGAVVQLSQPGRDELDRLGRREFSERLRRSCDGIERIAIPRLFRYVDRIPVNPQGKRETRSLRELFK